MSIGPVGSAIYTNQQMASVASEQTAQQNKFDLQNLAAAAIANDKDKEVQEIRPTEETAESNEDAQRKKHEEEENKKNKEKQDKETKTPPLHNLDIKV
ncbi:MAG TPA: hypothetical protein EYO73_06865 [Sulfurimonas sp.]|nr:hypothetical protein [Sulfurimonas sp.]